MEDPYQPPRDGSVTDGGSSAIWRGRIRGMAMFVSVATMLAGIVAIGLANRYERDIRNLRHDPPDFLPGWLWYLWNNLPELPLWSGLFVAFVGNSLARLEKGTLALVLSLAGALLVLSWGVILALGVATA